MAGIGFELKKIFQKKGVLALLKAYGYSGIVCVGPMILGVFLLFGIHILSIIAGATKTEQDLLTCMTTYTLLASMFITNGMGMSITRFVSDCLYEEKEEKIISSLQGSVSLMLIVGGVLYLGFLMMAGIPIVYGICMFVLFEELIMVWMEMNYLTAIKEYGGILKAFAVAAVTSLLGGYLLVCVLKWEVIPSLLSMTCVAYGILAIWYYILLLRYFPIARGSKVEFLLGFINYPTLFWIGTFTFVGMFGHMILMWHSSIGEYLRGVFYMAPQYDVPALIAFMTMLITTINFMTSVEVNFYPKYRNYYSLINDGGNLKDIEQAEREMRTTLQDELSYTAAKQVFFTIICLVLGSVFLPRLPLGFNDEMLGIFRVLCIGYAFYAIGNAVMLMSLYFADEKGALMSTAAFAIVCIVATEIFMYLPIRYYGFGFVVASALFMLIAILRLWYFQRHICYYVLSKQPIIRREKKGLIYKIVMRSMSRNGDGI